MATNKKITELTAAGALTGGEPIEVVQGGINVQTTTQDIADLGGGGVTSVNGETGAVTGFAKLASPTFTGTPAAPTAAAGTNTTQVATTAYVQQEIDSDFFYVSSFRSLYNY